MSSCAAFTEEWLADYQARTRAQAPLVPRYPADHGEMVPPPAPSNKYRAVRTEGRGPNGEARVYASGREAKRAAELALLKAAGTIADWFCQVPIAYGVRPNGKPARTIIDFLVIHEYRHDGMFVAELEDAKGFNTKDSQARLAALRGRGMQVKLI